MKQGLRRWKKSEMHSTSVGLPLGWTWGVSSIRTALVHEQVGKDADAFVYEGHAVGRVLPSSFYFLCESRRGVGWGDTIEGC